MSEQLYEHRAREEWRWGRGKAFPQSILDLLAEPSPALIPLHEGRTRLPIRGSHYRGLQHVPLSKIVGSEGRYADFDRYFLPRQTQTQERWQRINMARQGDFFLPPVELYKIGDVYFVKDGNHRVSV